MRVAALTVAALAACGRHSTHPDAPGPRPEATAAAPGFPATRWVPAKPTYVLAAKTLGDAQRGVRDTVESLGIAAGLDARDVSRASAGLLGVDVLSPEAVAAVGVDLRGGFALFSEGLDPTAVVHLAAPEQMTAFLERQRQRGLVTQSVVVDQTEVYTARVADGVDLSWAIAGDWMWLHLAFRAAHEDPTAWFAGSHAPHPAAWARDWQWAQGSAAAAATVVGLLDAHGLLARLAARGPDAVACARLAAPIARAAISLEGDGHRAGGTISLDLGPSAAAILALQLPAPAAWSAATATAPLAVQWNLDAVPAAQALAPCLALVAGGAPSDFSWVGIRAGRAALLAMDADGRGGRGVAALDLSRPDFLQSQLDKIPLRSTLERSRQFGPFAGHALSIPFGPTVEYVLAPHNAFFAMGPDLLAAVIGDGRTAPGPLAAVDVRPSALSREGWSAALHLIDLPHADRVAERLLGWREGHLSLAIQGTSLVFSAAGERR